MAAFSFKSSAQSDIFAASQRYTEPDPDRKSGATWQTQCQHLVR